jgi:hypothetical protein
MADLKISQLDAITVLAPAVDVLPVVSGGVTKKITTNQILGSGGTATLASATITGDLTVDTSTLKVDSTNNRVGILTASPRSGFALDVLGNVALGNSTTPTSNRLKLDCSGTAGNVAIMSFAAAGTNKAFFGLSGGYLGDASTDAIIATDAAGAAIRFCVSDTGTEAMRLNSTGLGVGDAPAANSRLTIGSTNATGFQYALRTTGITTGRSQIYLANTSGDLVTGIEGSTAGASITGSAAYSAYIGTATSNPFYLVTGGTVRATVDSAGNCGIGVTPSAWASGYKCIQGQIGGFALSNDNSSNNQFRLSSNAYFDTTDSRWEYFGASTATAYEQRAGEHRFFNAVSGSANAAITFTQAMTLTAGGELLLGTTSSLQNTSHSFKALGTSNSFWASTFQHDGTVGNPRLLGWRLPNSSDSSAYFVYAINSGGNCFNVFGNGSVNNSTGTYGTISDLRLKENISDARNYLADLLKLRVVKYSLKSEQSAVATKIGFVAQEVEQVFPTLVETNGDDVKSIKTSILIPMLLKAIQELTARVQTLEAR